MHKNAAKLLGLYILGVIGYAFFVSRFTIPVHLTVDEELYISMARSFHYQGHFSQGGPSWIIPVSCIPCCCRWHIILPGRRTSCSFSA